MFILSLKKQFLVRCIIKQRNKRMKLTKNKNKNKQKNEIDKKTKKKHTQSR